MLLIGLLMVILYKVYILLLCVDGCLSFPLAVEFSDVLVVNSKLEELLPLLYLLQHELFVCFFDVVFCIDLEFPLQLFSPLAIVLGVSLDTPIIL